MLATIPLFRSLAGAALDLLLPPHCAACDAQVAVPGQLCATCFQHITFIGEPSCRRCGIPFATAEDAGAEGQCRRCIVNPPSWRRAKAALLYDEYAKTLILPLKHTDREETVAVLALHMHRAGAALLAGAHALVPVPLHRSRLLARRYNQAALLAHAIGRRAHIPVLPDALQRTRPTVSLGGLDGAERHAALENAITVRPNRRILIAASRVVLIDDVLTSGATGNACARALLDAGAARVDVLVASRVPHPGRPQATPSDPEPNDAED